LVGKKFEELVNIMYKLRKECPWDAEQTHDSIKSATLEESYEVVEAIDDKDYNELKGELGDLLLHIVFHSVIAEDAGNFKIDEVIDGISDKLIRRHPHVFSDTKVNSNSEITRNWETIKLSEGRKSVVEGVPRNLPELHKAFRLQEKASKVGFDWNDISLVWDKVEEELAEVKELQSQNETDKLEEEIGDLLFSIVNYTRFIGINPENALRRTNEKFVRRFQYVEKKIRESGRSITDSNLEEMDKYWEESKKTE
jgi:MazG family protein